MGIHGNQVAGEPGAETAGVVVGVCGRLAAWSPTESHPEPIPGCVCVCVCVCVWRGGGGGDLTYTTWFGWFTGAAGGTPHCCC